MNSGTRLTALTAAVHFCCYTVFWGTDCHCQFSHHRMLAGGYSMVSRVQFYG